MLAHFIIFSSMMRYRFRLLSLPNFQYKKHTISYGFIHKFIVSEKSHNDDFNLQRELAIASIINGDVPESYYNKSPMWRKMRLEVYKFFKNLMKKTFPNEQIDIVTLECEHKAGRKNNNDLEVTVNKTYIFRIEFKFNATSVNGCPQFVSPYKPSNYLNKNFEEWFYDNCLQKIADHGNFQMPDKTEYISTINNSKVECMIEYK